MTSTSVNGQIARYLSSCELAKGLDTKTLKAYRIDLLQFADFINARDCELSKENLQA